MKKYMSGSDAIAWGAKLARVEVVSAYPITPNTPALLAISDLIASGEWDAVQLNTASELDAQTICAGSEAAGARTFNCTNSQGLALMHQALWMTSGLALPMVLAIPSRQLGAPQGLPCDYSDIMAERDSSIVQIYCETAQEVVDTMIMMYKVCEDKRVLLPGAVILEGFKHTHTYEVVDLPEQEDVDKYLPPYRPTHTFTDPKYPITQGNGVPAAHMIDGFKHQEWDAQQNAKQVIAEACADFAKMFGREYSPLVEGYKLDDADLVIVTIGTTAGLARQAADDMRKGGIKVGVLKIRSFRPFPEDEIKDLLFDKKKVLVIDRASSPGQRGGILYLEVRSALQRSQALISNFKIGTKDIYVKDVVAMTTKAHQSSEDFIEWFDFFYDQAMAKVQGIENYLKLDSGEVVPRETDYAVLGEGIATPGTNLCQGCISALAVRLAGMAFGPDTVVHIHGGCMGLAHGMWPLNSFKVPSYHFGFDGVGAAASGMEVALKKKGIKADIVTFGGDGGIMDIGLQTFSSALERGHKVIYFLYDNEAYMNTGVQRSSGTPIHASTKTTPHGKNEHKKDIMKIAESHRGVYTATVNVAHPQDLIRKMKKARAHNGPSFIHCICPCAAGWEHDSDNGIELSRLAVDTGVVVLQEQYEGERVINYLPKERKPLTEYLKLQGRYSHLTKEETEELQKEVDKQYEHVIKDSIPGLKSLDMPTVD